MTFVSIHKMFKHALVAVQQAMNESVYYGTEGTVNYIFDKGKNKTLLIVFSGIGGDYNYRSTLKKSHCNILYVKDTWAGGVSYYLYENGSSHPENLTSELILNIIESGDYQTIITIGSSKGGTAALYYGFKFHAHKIYIGSCQYELGEYIGRYQLTKNPEYYQRIMGNIEMEDGIMILNRKISDIISDNVGSPTSIKLLYSNLEHTYAEHILPLMKKLDECGVIYESVVCDFAEHSMVGLPFKQLLRKDFLES